MRVTNNSSREISVSINKWGDEGNTDPFKIAPGGDETWDRSDDRGFVMVVSQAGSREPYYILADSEIIINDNNVTDNNNAIKTASERYK